MKEIVENAITGWSLNKMKNTTALPEKKFYKGWHNWQDVQIPDLWHIAQNHPSQVAREAILLTWHLAHDAKSEIERSSGLLEACKAAVGRLAATDDCRGIISMLDKAIYKAESE